MDILTALNNLESGDTRLIKEGVDLLKKEGGREHIDALKNTKLKLPVYETGLIESIDEAVESITARSLEFKSAPENNQKADILNTMADSPAQKESVTDLSSNQASGSPQMPAAETGPAPGSNSQNYHESKTNGDPEENESSKNNDLPQNEYLDKVKEIWEKGKSAAIKNATFIKLKSQLNTIKNDKLVQLKHLGETVHKCFLETPSTISFIDEGISGIIEIDRKISVRQTEEKEIEESKAEGGFWNVVKSSISKFAGYTKIKLDISILQSNRESKLSALGQLIYDRLAECEENIIKRDEIKEVLLTIKDLERQREEKETEISEIAQSDN